MQEGKNKCLCCGKELDRTVYRSRLFCSKECMRKDYLHKYYLKHQDKIKKARKEERAIKREQYYAEHKEEIEQAKAERIAKTKEHRRIYEQGYYAKNKEILAEYHRKYQKENKGKINAYQRKRRLERNLKNGQQ